MPDFDGKYILQIIAMSLGVTLASTVISALAGLPLGYLLSKRSRVLRPFRSISTAMTGIPPVVAGLCVYFLLTRNGPFGQFRLLYSPAAMVIAQVLIVLPIIAAFVYPAFSKARQEIGETCAGLGISNGKIFRLLLRECRFACVSAVMTGFGRAISEVGAVMLAGGNIAGKTRVMTTAIMTETGKGNYVHAMLLGGLLLIISVAINLLAGRLRGESNE